MRYICTSIAEIKYVEKFIDKRFIEDLYSKFNETNYISIFDTGHYCKNCCEGCADFFYCDIDLNLNTSKYIIVKTHLREEKLKRIL